MLVCFFFISLQDIAVDAWAAEMFKEGVSKVSSTQTIGKKIGLGLGGIGFLTLNSLSFCNRFIYLTPQKTPIVDLEHFLRAWALLIVASTFFLAIFINEENQSNRQTFDFGKSFEIIADICKNKNV